MKLISSNVASEKKLIVFSQIVIILYYLPYFVFGEDAHILVHDNLDSNIAWIKILLSNNALFSSPLDKIKNVFNGLSVFQLYRSYDISLLLFKCFGIYFGYVINKLIVSFIGFWGIFLLLRSHFVIELSSVYNYIRVGVALVFSLLPFWSFSATVMGLPFLLFAFLNFRNKSGGYFNFLIVVVFAFYSKFVLSGIFMLIVLSLIFLFDIFMRRSINWQFFIGLSVLSIAYVISHFPLFYGFLFSETQSHRLEFFSETTSFFSGAYQAIRLFVKGQYHAHSVHLLFVFPVAISVMIWHKSFSKTIKLIFIFIVLTSLFYGFQYNSSTRQFVDYFMSLLPIQLQRFHILHPMLWYILLAVNLSWFAKRYNKLKVLIPCFLLLQFIYVVSFHEIWMNKKEPSFKEFYSEAMFNEIKLDIDRPLGSYNVISIGLHPAVAQYNGFYTLDGYFPNYPLDYKHDFREIIKEELEKNEKIRKYFDNWGSRCYVFSSELDKVYMYGKSNTKTISTLNYNWNKFLNMNGKYILSSVRININNQPQLKHIKTYKSNDSFWNINLYEVLAK